MTLRLNEGTIVRAVPEISRFYGIIVRMFHRVEARYVGGHTVWLRFHDRAAGEIDLEPELHGEVFEIRVTT